MIERIEQIINRRVRYERVIRKLSVQFWKFIENRNYNIAIVGNKRAIGKLSKNADTEQKDRVKYAITPRQVNQIIPKLVPRTAGENKGVDLVVIPDQHRKDVILKKVRERLECAIPVHTLFENFLVSPKMMQNDFRIDAIKTAALPKKTYVIASSRRTGGTMLCNMLRKTGGLGFPREYIQEKFTVLADQKRIKAGTVIVDAMKANQTPNGIFGISTHWSSLEKFKQFVFPSLNREEQTLVEDLYHNSSYIYLTRKNKIRQAISDWRAVNTGVFNIQLNDKDAVKEKYSEQISYNYKLIKRHLKNFIKEDEEWKKFFQRNNIVPIKISYEEMVQEPEETVSRIASHLGIEFEKLCVMPDTRKLSDEYTELIHSKFINDIEREYGADILEELEGITNTRKNKTNKTKQKPQKRKKHVLISLATADYLDMAKQFFASAYYNGGWDGDYLLLAHEIPETELTWFRDKGVIIRRCRSSYDDKTGGMHPSLASKFYMFTPFFKQWQTVIYSDLDAIVRGPLDGLKDIKGFNAVEDWSPTLREQIVNDDDIHERELNRNECWTMIDKAKKRYRLSKRPFCAGFFAFSTDIIAEEMFEALKRKMDEYHMISKFGDQLSFNFFFYDQWNKLKPTYNVLVRQEIDTDPYGEELNASTRWGLVKDVTGYILHIFNPKPWDVDSDFYLEWRSNLKKSEHMDLGSIQKLDPERLKKIRDTEERIKLRELVYRIIERFGPYKNEVIQALHFFYWKYIFLRRIVSYVSSKFNLLIVKKPSRIRY